MMNCEAKSDNHDERKLHHSDVVIEERSITAAVKKYAFVVGSALIVFAAARNTLTWYFERFWGASQDFWERVWGDIYDSCDGNSILLGIVGTNVLTIVVYWLFSLIFIIVDFLEKPSWIIKYKIQNGQNQPLDRKKFWKAVRWVLFNQIVIGVPLGFITWPLMVWRGCPFGKELPAFKWVVFEFAMFTLIEEFFFYYTHRLAHHPKLYKHFHKMHHEWTAPISIVAIYSHPIEHVISNVMPALMGPFIMGSHLGTSWLWFCMANITTIISHCGYHLPFLPSPEAHDFHHLKFNQNYGVLGVLDRLHGTDILFRNSKAYERHILLLGFVPMSETFPEKPKGCCSKADCQQNQCEK